MNNDSFLPKNKKKDPEYEKQLVFTVQQKLPGYKKAFRELQKMYEKPIEKMITQSLPRSGDVSKAQLMAVASNQFHNAIQKYDPNQNVDVFNWVNNNLRGHLKNVVKDDITGISVPRNESDTLFKFRQARHAAITQFGPNPTDHQILQFAPPTFTQTELNRAKKYDRKSLIGDSVVAKDDEGHGVTLNDKYMGLKIETNPNDFMFEFKSQRLIQLMKEKMTPKEFEILNDHIIKKQNMAQTALKHQISTTKLRSIVDKWYNIAQEENL